MAGTNYTILFTTKLDAAGVQAQIAKLTSKPIVLNAQVKGGRTATSGVTKSFTEIGTTATKANTRIRTLSKGISNVGTVATSTTSSFTGTSSKIQSIGTSAKQSTAHIKGLNTGLVGFKTSEKGVEGATTKMQTLGQKVKGVGTNFTSTIGKVAKFGAATAVIGGFTAAVADAFNEVKTLDDSVTQFKKVSDLSGTKLDTYVKNLGKSGQTVARTTSEMVDAATS